MTFCTEPLAKLFQNTFNGLTKLQDWFTLPKTTFTKKRTNLYSIAKNNRPISCLNVIYELCIRCFNSFQEHQCRTTNIITTEQVVSKNSIWEILEQLLINKKIIKEAKTLKRNMYTIWLDYQKVFNSVTHDLLLRLLKLAKVPPQLISAIESLGKSWATTTVTHISNSKPCKILGYCIVTWCQ